MIPDFPKNKKIVLFDGVCNLCDSSVLYIIKRDKNDVFRFVSLQSELGQQILKYIGIDPKKTDSIVLYEPGIAYYVKSTAILEIIKNLRGVFGMNLIFSLVPLFLRDPIYDYVAKNRYKWYGKKDKCLIPTQELQSKFL